MKTKLGIKRGRKQVLNAAKAMRCYCCGYLNIQAFIAGDWDNMCNHVCGHSFFQSKRAQLMLDLWAFGEILPPDLAYIETHGEAEYKEPFAVYLGKKGGRRSKGLSAFLSDYERLQDCARRLGKPVKALLADFVGSLSGAGPKTGPSEPAKEPTPKSQEPAPEPEDAAAPE